MNDRYLYRAKRKNWRELPKEMWWVEGYLYGIWERRYILWGMTNDVPNMVEVDPSTICQCTGLKDKNGKLIWENDVVKCKCGIAVVVWDKSEWRFKWVKDTIWRKDLHFWVNDENESGVEVIGSAIDNPELLEVEE